MRIRLALVALAAVACTQGEAVIPPSDVDADPIGVSTTTVPEATPTTATTVIPATTTTTLAPEVLVIEEFPVPSGSRPHDVAPAVDGGIWYTAQGSGELGWLDPETGETRHTPLGSGSRPHGVIVDHRGTPWVTDSGLNALVSVDPGTLEVTVHALPAAYPGANLNTAAFDGEGRLWFTGQGGVYGFLEPETGHLEVFDAPHGRGPYGIAATPDGSVYYASLAGSYIAAIGRGGAVTVIDPPTPGQGARRVWSDSAGRIWVSEWNSGNLSRYTPESGEWDIWPLPGGGPSPYAVYVDDRDIVWVSDFVSNSMVRFDPVTEEFHVYPLPNTPGNVRQILGRPGEVWSAESAADTLIVIRTR